MKQAKIVKIVFCGPGDVSKELEIAAEVIEKWNLRNFEALNCGVSLTNWKKNSVPSMEKRGQAVINGQLIDEADLMIAVFWRRFGTPTGMHSSGTEEEVVRAMAREIPVMLYFSDLEAPMIEPDHEQAKLLEDFRRRAMATGLPGTFRSRRDFKEQLERHLDENIRKFLTAGWALEFGGDGSNLFSGDSQFFICFDGCGHLTGQYTVWGQVVSGMGVVENLAVGEPPSNPDKMISVRLGKK